MDTDVGRNYAWTATSGYEHFPAFINLTGNRLAVRGPEKFNGEYYEQGDYASAEIPDDALAELASAIETRGFDPSRVFEQMQRYYDDANQAGWLPFKWHISEPLYRDLSGGDARLAEIMGMPIVVHDEWSWGWMMTARPVGSYWDSDAKFWELRRDMDSGDAQQESK